jgi:hypothetical protein
MREVMSQGKHKASAAARSRPRPLGRAAKPAIDDHNRTPWDRVRPRAGERPAEKQDAPCPQNYLQWAAFAASTPEGDLGFGAYFADPSSAPSTRSTWTPARRG